MPWLLRALGYVGRAVLGSGKYVLRAGKGLWGSTAAFFARTGGAKWFWRALDIGSWAWLAYDILSDDDTAESLVKGNDYFSDIVLDKAITAAITTDIADREAVIYAFTNTGLSVFARDTDSGFLKGLAYCACADYLSQTPTVDELLYADDEVKEVLSNADEVTKALYPNAHAELGEAAGGVTEFLASLDMSGMAFETRKQMDFLTHFFTLVFDMLTEDGKIDINRNRISPMSIQGTSPVMPEDQWNPEAGSRLNRPLL